MFDSRRSDSVMILKKFSATLCMAAFLFCAVGCSSDKSDNLSSPTNSSEVNTQEEIQPTNKPLTKKQINDLEGKRYILIGEAIDIHEKLDPKNKGSLASAYDKEAMKRDAANTLRKGLEKKLHGVKGFEGFNADRDLIIEFKSFIGPVNTVRVRFNWNPQNNPFKDTGYTECKWSIEVQKDRTWRLWGPLDMDLSGTKFEYIESLRRQLQNQSAPVNEPSTNQPAQNISLSLGGLGLGGNVNDIHNVFGGEKEIRPSQTMPGSSFYEYNDVVITVNGGTVTGIASYTNAVQTEKGIRQGDPLSKVFSAYGNVCALTDYEDEMLYEYPFELGGGKFVIMRFAVKNNAVDYISLRTVDSNEFKKLYSARRSL